MNLLNIVMINSMKFDLIEKFIRISFIEKYLKDLSIFSSEEFNSLIKVRNCELFNEIL
jgi:hypothetical protein